MRKSFLRRSWVFAALLIACVAAPCAGESLRLDVKEYTIANGLKVLILERHRVPIFSACIYYRVGSVNESTGSTGISHFIEHLMFKGTRTLGTKDFAAESEIIRQKDDVMSQLAAETRRKEKRPSLIEKLQKRFQELDAEHRKLIVSNESDKVYTENGAAGINASTSFDWTNYFLSLPSNRFELWCAIQSDVMRYPVFRQFYQERNVIQEERRWSYETNPGGALYEQLIAAAYTTHPYGMLVIGAMSDMQSFTREQVRDFYTLHYAPNRAVVCLVGDVHADKVIPLIEKYFGSIPSQPDPPAPVTVEPEQKGERRVAVEFDANPQLGIAFHKVPMTHADQAAFDVLAQILSSGRTSRLYRKLIEELQIAVDIWSGDSPGKYPNLYYIFAEPRAPHTIEDVEKVIYAELDRLKVKPVSSWELQKAKNRLEASFISQLDSNSGLAARIGLYEAIDTWRHINTALDRWKAVSAEDIMRVALAYLKKSNSTVAFIEKVAPGEHDAPPADKADSPPKQ
ncbi:insulinase family protein [bacterium]|nr:insulinase family protein [bacterium]